MNHAQLRFAELLKLAMQDRCGLEALSKAVVGFLNNNNSIIGIRPEHHDHVGLWRERIYGWLRGATPRNWQEILVLVNVLLLVYRSDVDVEELLHAAKKPPLTSLYGIAALEERYLFTYWFAPEHQRPLDPAAAPSLVALTDDVRPAAISLTADTFHLGTLASNTIVLPHPRISRLHCIIQREQPGSLRFTITDWSRHGTFLDGTRIERGRPYLLLDHVEIGCADPTPVLRFLDPMRTSS